MGRRSRRTEEEERALTPEEARRVAAFAEALLRFGETARELGVEVSVSARQSES